MQGAIRNVSPSPSTLFHFSPEALLGKQLADVVDIFSMWTVSGVWGIDHRCKRIVKDQFHSIALTCYLITPTRPRL